MTDEQKKVIIEKVSKMLPNVSKERISSVLDLVLLEIGSYNTCKIEIDSGFTYLACNLKFYISHLKVKRNKL